jgi:hypothetical protein
MANITISDGLLILATVTGPILAVQAQKWVERATDKRRQRLLIFSTLMTKCPHTARRGSPSQDHTIPSLNLPLRGPVRHTCRNGRNGGNGPFLRVARSTTSKKRAKNRHFWACDTPLRAKSNDGDAHLLGLVVTPSPPSAQRRHAHGHHQHSVFREEFENVVSASRI